MTAPSSFPNGFSHGVDIRGLPILNSYPGKVFYVSSVVGSNGNRGSFERPFATLAYAALAANLKATASKGDLIFLMPGHIEAVTAAGGITIDIAGLSIISLGEGDLRPRFSFSGSTAASILVSADNVSLEGCELACGLEGMTNPLSVTGNGFYADIRGRDASTSFEAARYVLMTGSSRSVVKLKHNGFNGNGCVNSIQLDGCTDIRIELDSYGKASTGWVEFINTASTNVVITGTTYNTGTTDGSKTVVDTVGGSTWSIQVFDAAAGVTFMGGSGLTPSSSSAVRDALYGTNGIVTWLTAAAYGNNVSISEVLAYVQDGVRRGSGTPMAANKSVADALGTDGTTVTDSAVTVLGAIGPNNANNAFDSSSVVANKDGSVMERLEAMQDVTGAYIPGLGYKVTKVEDISTATGVDLFTVTNMVYISLWVVEVTSTLNGSPTDYKIRVKTDNVDLCAASSIASAATGAMFQMCGDAGDTLINTASALRTADTNGKGPANRIVGNSSGSCILQSLRTAGAGGNQVKHTVYYMPLIASALMA